VNARRCLAKQSRCRTIPFRPTANSASRWAGNGVSAEGVVVDSAVVAEPACCIWAAVLHPLRGRMPCGSQSIRVAAQSAPGSLWLSWQRAGTPPQSTVLIRTHGSWSPAMRLQQRCGAAATSRRAPPSRACNGLFVAGDHRDTASIQGALVSGRRAATAVLAELESVPLDSEPVRLSLRPYLAAQRTPTGLKVPRGCTAVGAKSGGGARQSEQSHEGVHDSRSKVTRGVHDSRSNDPKRCSRRQEALALAP
jgi:hypothetical protein